MTHICPKCGQMKRFKKVVYGRASFTEEQTVDEEEDIISYDNIDYEDQDYEDSDAPVCMYCSDEPESEWFDDEKQLLIFQAEHTDKKGKWHEEKLEQPNEELVKKAVMLGL